MPFPESSLNDEAGKNFMSNYDEYYRRAKLLASVHGLSTWSTSTHTRANDDEDDECKKPSYLSTSNSSNSANPLGKTGSRSNIVRSGSKMLDKKNKKKSLRRL